MDVLLFLVHTNIMPQSLYQYFYASVILTYVWARYVYTCVLYVRRTRGGCLWEDRFIRHLNKSKIMNYMHLYVK